MLLDEAADRGSLHDAALPDDDQVIGGQGHLTHQMGAQEDRLALGGSGPAEFAHPLDPIGIKTVDGFVQDKVPGIAQKGRRNGEPLTHTQGEGAGALVLYACQSHHLHDLVDPSHRNPVGGGQGTQMGISRARLVG